MKKDIETRADIELLVNSFYEKIMADDELGFIFQEIAHVNWVTHLPAMYDFWENIILFTGSYEGNPMHLHKHLHHISSLTDQHFTRWNKLFSATIDSQFEGINAEKARSRALSISAVMKANILKKQQEDQDKIY
ncbi:MAG: group III truncated hemoglobin [Ferruginibacter sp.]